MFRSVNFSNNGFIALSKVLAMCSKVKSLLLHFNELTLMKYF